MIGCPPTGFQSITGPQREILGNAMREAGLKIPGSGLQSMRKQENLFRREHPNETLAIRDIELPEDVIETLKEAHTVWVICTYH